MRTASAGREEVTLDHPLPNLHGAVQFIRNFHAHYHEAAYNEIWDEIVFLFGEESVKCQSGNFCLAHDSTRWLFEELWAVRVNSKKEHESQEDILRRELREIMSANERAKAALSKKTLVVKSIFD